MSTAEVAEIISRLEQLWPKWEISSAERATWKRAIIDLDYDCVRDAIMDFFNEQSRNFSRPLPAPVIEKARAFQQKRFSEKPKNEPQLAYTLECIEHKDPKFIGRKQRFYHNQEIKRNDWDRIKRAAENKLEHIGSCYGGQWIVINNYEPLPF